MVQNQKPLLGELPPPNLRVQPHIRKHETETRRFLPAGAPFPSAASQNVRAGKKKRKRKGEKRALQDGGAERSRGGDVGKCLELHSEFPRFLETLEEVLLQNKSLNFFFTFYQRSETLFQQVCVCSDQTTGAQEIKTLIKLTSRNEKILKKAFLFFVFCHSFMKRSGRI